MDPSRFVLPIIVQASDIDFMGHVNNAVYLTWVQQAVLAHWRDRVDEDVASRHLWIALKHEITYRRPAYLGDTLAVSVALETVRRESAFYDTGIRRGAEVIAEVRSRWCCLDAVSHRPTRLEPCVVERFIGAGRSALDLSRRSAGR